MSSIESGEPLAILIVDDREEILRATARLLRELDCEVVCTSSGEAALEHLRARDFSALLLDVQMPKMSGFELARLARQIPRAREAPILFLTGMPETPDNLFEGYESGAVDVLFKPVDVHVLVSKVKIFLEHDRSKRRLAAEIAAHQRTLAELEAFNDSVSHDLRAPLRAVSGFSQILAEDHAAGLDAAGREALAHIQAASHRMDALIEDLLRLSRVSRGQIEMRSLDLSTLAREIVADMRRADPLRVIEIVLPSTLPARGDERLLRIALENLLRNAWKFTRTRASARIEIGVVRDEHDKTAYFVGDDGVGFDLAHARRLFMPFQRMHSSDEFEGTGIGLAIVRRVIERHGGRIWAEAAPDRGARFLFTLS